MVRHRFNSPKEDGADPDQVQPSYWNDGHVGGIFTQSSDPDTDANNGDIWVNQDDTSDLQLKIRKALGWEGNWHFIGVDFLVEVLGAVGGGTEGYKHIFEVTPTGLSITLLNPSFDTHQIQYDVNQSTGAVSLNISPFSGSGILINQIFGAADPRDDAGVQAIGGSIFFQNDGAGNFAIYQKMDDDTDTNWSVMGGQAEWVDPATATMEDIIDALVAAKLMKQHIL